MKPLTSHAFNAAAITSRWPPVTGEPNKTAVWTLAAQGDPPRGTITVSRWAAPPLDAWQVRSRPEVVLLPGFFTYGNVPAGEHHWHVNFANFDLFSAYGTRLLAQDELQVLEHPALASVRHALLDLNASTLCTENGEPFPILVSGVERRITFDTSPRRMAPMGLYGNHFARAPIEAVRDAATSLRPPTLTNLLAIEAPAYGDGAYDAPTIAMVFRTAAAGFAAARHEATGLRRLPAGLTVIHSGFWGCGAYGGNRELMCLLQVLAAGAAGVDRLVLYTADAAGAARKALEVSRELPSDATPDELITLIRQHGYRWGVSNGT